MLIPVLTRFDKLLSNEPPPLISAALTTREDIDPMPERFADPMQANICWVPPIQTSEGSVAKPKIQISVNRITTLHDTWFKSKESAQYFLNTLKEQVDPATPPAAFAELVAAFLFLQEKKIVYYRSEDKIITLLDCHWLLDRKRLPDAIKSAFLVDSTSDQTIQRRFAVGDSIHFSKTPAAQGSNQYVQWLSWHIPDDATDITIAFKTAALLHVNGAPSLTRLIVDEPHELPCRLIYERTTDRNYENNDYWLYTPQKAHYGRVNWVEYMEHYSPQGFASTAREATALADLFKPNADPEAVGMCLTTLKRFQSYPRDNDRGFQPTTSNAHHWHAVWPIQYEDQIKQHEGADHTTNMELFFKGLITIAHPEYTVRGDTMRPEGLPIYYEFQLEPIQGGPTEAAWRYFECVADSRHIKIKITDKPADIASMTETERDEAFSPPGSDYDGHESDYDSDYP